MGVRWSSLSATTRTLASCEFELAKYRCTDGIDLPLWLRVHYRVNHPELTPAPAGAVGDYPEALENLHEWMKTHQDLGREP